MALQMERESRDTSDMRAETKERERREGEDNGGDEKSTEKVWKLTWSIRADGGAGTCGEKTGAGPLTKQKQQQKKLNNGKTDCLIAALPVQGRETRTEMNRVPQRNKKSGRERMESTVLCTEGEQKTAVWVLRL